MIFFSFYTGDGCERCSVGDGWRVRVQQCRSDNGQKSWASVAGGCEKGLQKGWSYSWTTRILWRQKTVETSGYTRSPVELTFRSENTHKTMYIFFIAIYLRYFNMYLSGLRLLWMIFVIRSSCPQPQSKCDSDWHHERTQRPQGTE